MSDYPRDQRKRGNGDNSGIPWPLIIIAFCIFWPVGILLLLLKFSQDAKLQQHKEDWVNALNNQDIPFAQRQETAARLLGGHAMPTPMNGHKRNRRRRRPSPRPRRTVSLTPSAQRRRRSDSKHGSRQSAGRISKPTRHRVPTAALLPV